MSHSIEVLRDYLKRWTHAFNEGDQVDGAYLLKTRQNKYGINFGKNEKGEPGPNQEDFVRLLSDVFPEDIFLEQFNFFEMGISQPSLYNRIKAILEDKQPAKDELTARLFVLADHFQLVLKPEIIPTSSFIPGYSPIKIVKNPEDGVYHAISNAWKWARNAARSAFAPRPVVAPSFAFQLPKK